MDIFHCKLIFLNVLVVYLHVLYIQSGLTMVHSEEDCGPNAEWNSCGSACAPTCELHYSQRVCTAVCVSGCYCKTEYLRESDGTCVRECKPRT